MSLGTKPASTAAREAPIAAPSASATGSSSFVKFSPDCRPRPPEMMMRGGGQLGPVRLRQLGPDESRQTPAAAGAATVSTAAEPPSAADGNAEMRTVMTFLASRRLHRLDSVAGVDRPLEGVGEIPW